MWKINWNWFILAWKRQKECFHGLSGSKWENLQLPQCIALAAPPTCFRLKGGRTHASKQTLFTKLFTNRRWLVLTRFSKSNHAQWLFGTRLHRKVEVGTECKFSRFASERRSALQTMAAGDKQPQSWRRHREGNYKRKNDMQSPFQTGGFWWKTFRQDKVRTQTNCCSVRLRCGPVPRWRTGRGF